MRKYNTRQRELILNVFTQEPDRCFSAKEMIELCACCGQATVYRTLAVLESEGKIKRFRGRLGGDCFKLSQSEPDHRHIHIVCRSCGDMIHSECDFIGELAGHLASHHNFTLDTSNTVIYGTCGKCAEDTSL